MKKVRWGLVSTAKINEKVIPAIRASPFSELSAVASRDLFRANDYAQNWGIPHAFGSYQEMYDSGTVDAVYISLPNHMHAEWTIRALKAGIHVLCEKPFAITLADVDAMILASSQTGSLLAEAFMYRHHPQTKIAGDFVRSGRLGSSAMLQAPSHLISIEMMIFVCSPSWVADAYGIWVFTPSALLNTYLVVPQAKSSGCSGSASRVWTRLLSVSCTTPAVSLPRSPQVFAAISKPISRLLAARGVWHSHILSLRSKRIASCSSTPNMVKPRIYTCQNVNCTSERLMIWLPPYCTARRYI